MVVVVDQFGNVEFGCGLSFEYFTGASGVDTGFAWAASSAFDKVLLSCDAVDGGEHGDGCIIHPDNGKNLVFDNHSRKGIPLQLRRLAQFKGFRKVGRVDASGPTGTNIELTQVSKEGNV